MSDKKKTNKKKISTLVKQQAPQFVLENHPKFTEFLTSYFLFLESAEMTLQTFTEIDHILLETDATANNFILFERTNSFGLDSGDKLVAEENDFAGSFEGEIIKAQHLVRHQQF